MNIEFSDDESVEFRKLLGIKESSGSLSARSVLRALNVIVNLSFSMDGKKLPIEPKDTEIVKDAERLAKKVSW